MLCYLEEAHVAKINKVISLNILRIHSRALTTTDFNLINFMRIATVSKLSPSERNRENGGLLLQKQRRCRTGKNPGIRLNGRDNDKTGVSNSAGSCGTYSQNHSEISSSDDELNDVVSELVRLRERRNELRYVAVRLVVEGCTKSAVKTSLHDTAINFNYLILKLRREKREGRRKEKEAERARAISLNRSAIVAESLQKDKCTTLEGEQSLLSFVLHRRTSYRNTFARS